MPGALRDGWMDGWVERFTSCPNQVMGLCWGDAPGGPPGFWSALCSRSREVKNKTAAKILPSGLSHHFPRLCGVVWGLPKGGAARL